MAQLPELEQWPDSPAQPVSEQAQALMGSCQSVESAQLLASLALGAFRALPVPDE